MRDQIEALRSGSIIDAWEAAKSLARSSNAELLWELTRIVQNSDEVSRRVAATWVLGFIRTTEARDVLTRLLDDPNEPPALREQAAESLGYLADDAARSVVLRHLFDDNQDVSFSCAFALRTIGYREDIAALEKLAMSKGRNSYGASVSEEARGAIDNIKGRRPSV